MILLVLVFIVNQNFMLLNRHSILLLLLSFVHLLSVIFLMLLFIAYRITMVWKFIIFTFCLIKS